MLILLALTKKTVVQTPIKGVNAWFQNLNGINELDAAKTAHRMVKEGFLSAGYNYFILPDGFLKETRNATGYLVADKDKFPKGIASFVDFLHDNDLKFGILIGAGIKSCSGRPGMLGNEEKDIKTFVSWGVDFISYQLCGSVEADFKENSNRVANLLNKSLRKIVLEINDYGQTKSWTWAPQIAHQWRTTKDITYVKNQCNFLDILANYEQNVILDSFSGVSAFNFPDALCTDMPGISDAESKTQMALWTIMNSPLIIAANLDKMLHSNVMNLINENIVRIHSDTLTIAGKIIAQINGIDVIARPLDDGSVALVIFNKNEQPQNIQVSLKQISDNIQIVDSAKWTSASSYLVTDVWTWEEQSTGSKISVMDLNGHSSVMVIVKPE
ncbi:Alpha-galactosidase [Spironucleus salmonicida]|uniref:Alpha-galactosidase n=1 Tax=Spironucleus salmonicida TaxID=348837 RepID=V6LFH3_9EUKA|nr:Alpha-galactosidase [Spironucleus salmonicida]|eukprot:EST43290.1 Alpha-galactosidase [Spironucleus salmonicida]